MADYVTLAEVKEQLQDLGTDYDVLLPKFITRSSRDIDRLTGQFFDLKAGVTNLFDGSDTRLLFLPRSWPLITVTTLQVRLGGTTMPFVTLPSSDYFLEPTSRPTGWPARFIELTDVPSSGGINKFYKGKRTVSVLGDWGWTAMPDDIKEICLELIIGAWRNRGKGGHLPSAGVDPGVDEPVLRSLSPRSIAVLRTYGYQQPADG